MSYVFGISKVSKACTVNFKAVCETSDHGMLDIPAGLVCCQINEGTAKGNFFLEEFPINLFPINSIVRHDAIHYGVMLTPDQVTVREPLP